MTKNRRLRNKKDKLYTLLCKAHDYAVAPLSVMNRHTVYGLITSMETLTKAFGYRVAQDNALTIEYTYRMVQKLLMDEFGLDAY